MEHLPKLTRKIEVLNNAPIPPGTVTGWKNIPIQENGEKLVPLGAFTSFSDCDTSAAYFGERGEGKDMNFVEQPVDRNVSLISHFVREGVLNKLKQAQESLPEGYYFRFYDNYRPLAVQQKLFDVQKEKLRAEHHDWDEEKLKEETQRYVSLPSPSEEEGTTHPSPHSTGGVVDLSIIKMDEAGQKLLKELSEKKARGELNYPTDESEKSQLAVVDAWIEREAAAKGWTEDYKKSVKKNWLSEYRYARTKAKIFKQNTAPLNMGTDFDYFGPEAATTYFEDQAKTRTLTASENEALMNRRFLYTVMKSAGFSNYPEEWWHWSYGDSMDAASVGKPNAIYGGVGLSQENKNFENSRRGPYERAKQDTGKKGLFMNEVEDDPTSNGTRNLY